METESCFNEDQNPANTESANSVAQEDSPKKSYASIVTSQKRKGHQNLGTHKYFQNVFSKVVKQSVAAVAQTAALEASNTISPGGINEPETNDTEHECIISLKLA